MTTVTATHGQIRREARTVLPTEYALFDLHLFAEAVSGNEHMALVLGNVDAACAGPKSIPPLVRVHSECLTGDALGSRRCDCGDRLRSAQRAIAAEGRGVILYLGSHAGRGSGLIEKLKAYELLDGAPDTVGATHQPGCPVDARNDAAAAAMLRQLNVPRLRLLASNGITHDSLSALGIDVVDQVPLTAEHPDTAPELTGSDRPPTATVWTRLLKGQVGSDPTLTADGRELVSRYAPLLAAGSRLVLAQLGQSLDGFIAARSGDAEFVTGDEDREHLHRLRALVDAVVVGTGTVVADDCRLTVRAVEGENPVRVLLDPAARIPVTAAVLNDGAAATLWCVGPAAMVPATSAQVEVVRLPLSTTAAERRFDPDVVIAYLADRGLGRVLVEGGGRTVSEFLAAGVLDRLFVTTAPVLIGDGVPGLRFEGADRLADALRAPARRFLFGPDTCIEFDLASARTTQGRAGA